MRESKVFEARVEGIGRQGEGSLEHEGARHYLGGALPGDEVRFTIDRRGRAKLLEILRPSPDRVDAACEIEHACGGCPLISLEDARAAKEKHRALIEATGFKEAAFTPSPRTLGYRRRARLAFDAGRGLLGYRGRRSRSIANAARCPILTPPLEASLPAIRTLLRSLKGRGEMLLGDTLDGVYLTIDADAFQAPEAYRALESLSKEPGWAGIALRAGGLSEASFFGRESERHLAPDGLDFETPPGGFLQVNAEINALLARRVAEWAEPEGASIVELFSGAGNLSVLLARGARALHAVEEYAPASEYAARNLKARHLRAKLSSERAEEAALSPADVLVMNPPRSGFPGIARAVQAVKPERVVLVSCDLGSLRRELRTLEAEGYAIEALEGFDMFPRTPHLEAAAKLRRVLAARPR